LSDLLELVSLQSIDDDLDEARARLAAVEERLAGNAALEAARTALAEARERLAGLERDRRALDGQLQDLGARIEREEKKLYDGSIMQFKELQALGTEVDHLREERTALDERGLGLLAEIEAQTAAVATAESEFASLDREWQAVSAGLIAEASNLKKRIESGEQVRSAQAAKVTTGAVRTYEGLRRRKGGKAVVRLQGASCLGCRVAVPDAVRRRIMNSPVLVQCPQCERILAVG
jgi:predicted  nucleic acid-binding Zn-ribbon protein